MYGNPYQPGTYNAPENKGSNTALIVVIVALTLLAVVIATFLLLIRPAWRRLSYYQYNTVGNQYYRKGNYQAAIDQYSIMVEVRPNKFDGYSLRGMAEYRAGMHTAAIKDYTTCINLLGTQAGIDEIGYGRETPAKQRKELPSCLGSVYYNRALAYDASGNHRAAVRDYTSGLSNTPNDWKAHWARAEDYRILRNYPAAMADAQAVVALYPTRSSTYKLRGDIERDSGNTAAALADYSKAILIKGTYFGAYYARSEIFIKNHQFAQEVANWQQAVTTMPNNTNAWCDLGWAKYLNSDPDGSIEASRLSIKLDKTNVTSQFNLALCYAVKGNWSTAQPIYQQALAQARPVDRAGALDDIKNALKAHTDAVALRNAYALFNGHLPV